MVYEAANALLCRLFTIWNKSIYALMINYEQYRENTQYEGVYKYVAPDGKHWECEGTNYGNIIWGGVALYNRYALVDNC